MIRYLITATLALSLGVAALSAGGAQEAQTSTTRDFDAFIGETPTPFATVDELVEAFRKALAEDDKEAVASLLGLSPSEVLKSKEVEASFPQIREEAAKSIAVKELASDRRSLLLGDQVWPFPFPVVQTEGKWAFDTIAGLEEVINRRIGENELTTVANLRAYVDAQEDYKETDWDEDGVGEYAGNRVTACRKARLARWSAKPSWRPPPRTAISATATASSPAKALTSPAVSTTTSTTAT
jgi:hypothetical protein